MEVKEYNLEFKKMRLNTKTIVILCFVFGILVLRAYKIITPFFVISNEIHELNENINIPYKFGTPLDEYEFDSAIWEQSNGYIDISYMKDESECFTFSGYPDYSCSYRFTDYWSSNPETSIFGIHVGDSLEYAEYILKNNGYRQEDKSSGDNKYRKGKVSIWLSFNKIISGTGVESYPIIVVDKFYINIKSTDWLHKGYYK